MSPRFDLEPLLSRTTPKRGERRPTLVALDGRSGTGKSTLAKQLAHLTRGVVVQGDDFYSGGVLVRSDTPRERAAACIDWREQRRVLEALRKSQPVAWHAFDWTAFDGSYVAAPTTLDPAPIVILEGVYSTRPELADLLDLKVLVRVPEEVRLRQLRQREGCLSPWELQWHEAEDYYFGHVAPPEHFDLLLEPEASTPPSADSA